MQSEPDERGAAYQLQLHPPRADDHLPPFSDTSSFVNVPDAVRDLVEASGGWLPPQAPPPTHPPSSFQPPSSSHAETESLMQHAAQHAEHLTALSYAASSFSRRYNKFAPLRAEILLLRSRVEFEWMVCADQRRFVSESQDAFAREATLLCDSLPPEYSTAKLLSLQAQVVRDHKRQAENLMRTSDTETELSHLEFALQQKEFRLAQAAQRIADVLSQLNLPEPGGSPPSTQPSVVNEKEVPPLVQYYFDKAGDVGVEREKIMELELQHREERESRIFQEDQDTILQVSEEEFEEIFNKQLAEAEAALAEALRRAENAKQVCIDSNLDPDLYRDKLLQVPAGRSDRSRSDNQVPEAHESPLPTVTPNGHPSPSTLPLGSLAAVKAPSQDQFLTSEQPVQTVGLESFLSQGLSSQQLRQDNSAPFDDRIRGWIDDVSVEDGNAHTGLLSRSRSTETYPSPLVLEKRQDGTWRVNKAASQSRREERRESQQRDHAAYVEDHGGEQRPILLKRSSSESKVLVLPSWEGSYQDAVDNIRGLRPSKP